MPPKIAPKLPTGPSQGEDDTRDEETKQKDEQCYSCIGITYYNAEMARLGLPPLCTGLEQKFGPRSQAQAHPHLAKRAPPSRINDEGEVKILYSSWWTGYMTRTGRGPVVDGPMSYSCWESEKSAGNCGNKNVKRLGIHQRFFDTNNFFKPYMRFAEPDPPESVKLFDLTWGPSSSIPRCQMVKLESPEHPQQGQWQQEQHGSPKAKARNKEQAEGQELDEQAQGDTGRGRGVSSSSSSSSSSRASSNSKTKNSLPHSPPSPPPPNKDKDSDGKQQQQQQEKEKEKEEKRAKMKKKLDDLAKRYSDETMSIERIKNIGLNGWGGLQVAAGMVGPLLKAGGESIQYMAEKTPGLLKSFFINQSPELPAKIDRGLELAYNQLSKMLNDFRKNGRKGGEEGGGGK